MFQGQNSTIACSVAICTYNGAMRVPHVLKVLARQEVNKSLQWEILVIDNASRDNTFDVCERALNKLSVPAKVVSESEPGLVFARRRAALEAQGDIICFLDDDNFPAQSYVENAINAFARDPVAGVIGGRVVPKWEYPPSPLALSAAGFALAICDLGDKQVEITALGGGIVGAGMCIRRKLLHMIFESKQMLTSVSGRKGTSLIGGEDLAISILARDLGFKTIYDPRLVIEHVIPKGRMNKSYLQKLYEGIGRGQAATRRIYDWKARCPLAFGIAMKDFFRWGYGEIWKNRSIGLERDLKDLNQRQIWGRAIQAIKFMTSDDIR